MFTMAVRVVGRIGHRRYEQILNFLVNPSKSLVPPHTHTLHAQDAPGIITSEFQTS
jgi:hypothetical protein